MIYLTLKGVFQLSEICEACNILIESHYLVGVSENEKHDRKICEGCYRVLTQNPVDKLRDQIEKENNKKN